MTHERTTDDSDSRVMHRLLELIARDSAMSQRHLAQELGIALGLVNAYLKRCVGKGLIKVQQAPAKRFAYYLTPTGFAEKSRLTVNYLVYSMSFFRLAKADCLAVFDEARRRDHASIALAGQSDLAEICIICGHETAVDISAVVDRESGLTSFAGVPVARSFEDVVADIDAVIITDLVNTERQWAAAVARFGEARVLIPDLLKSKIGALYDPA